VGHVGGLDGLLQRAHHLLLVRHIVDVPRSAGWMGCKGTISAC
jgi:hypothetical protein